MTELEPIYRGKNLRAALRSARHVRDWSYNRVLERTGLGASERARMAVTAIFKGEADVSLGYLKATMQALGVQLRYRSFTAIDPMEVLRYAIERREMSAEKVINLANLVGVPDMTSLYSIQAMMKALGVEAIGFETGAPRPPRVEKVRSKERVMSKKKPATKKKPAKRPKAAPKMGKPRGTY